MARFPRVGVQAAVDKIDVRFARHESVEVDRLKEFLGAKSRGDVLRYGVEVVSLLVARGELRAGALGAVVGPPRPSGMSREDDLTAMATQPQMVRAAVMNRRTNAPPAGRGAARRAKVKADAHPAPCDKCGNGPAVHWRLVNRKRGVRVGWCVECGVPKATSRPRGSSPAVAGRRARLCACGAMPKVTVETGKNKGDFCAACFAIVVAPVDDAELLAACEAHGWRTPAELSASTGLPLKRVKDTLERLFMRAQIGRRVVEGAFEYGRGPQRGKAAAPTLKRRTKTESSPASLDEWGKTPAGPLPIECEECGADPGAPCEDPGDVCALHPSRVDEMRARQKADGVRMPMCGCGGGAVHHDQRTRLWLCMPCSAVANADRAKLAAAAE